MSKIAIASQANNTYKYFSTKQKSCNAYILFRQQCLKKDLIPKYVSIQVPNTSPALFFLIEYQSDDGPLGSKLLQKKLPQYSCVNGFYLLTKYMKTQRCV
jgi:hypothetical protein